MSEAIKTDVLIIGAVLRLSPFSNWVC